MNKIYYAHHQWKYGTKEETEELKVIKRNFEGLIINPNGWIYENGDETYCMGQCFHFIKNICDILVFTTLVDGTIGKGVHDEIKCALDNFKKVFYLNQDGIIVDFNMKDYEDIEVIVKETGTNRRYAKIN